MRRWGAVAIRLGESYIRTACVAITCTSTGKLQCIHAWVVANYADLEGILTNHGIENI
jgi:hypothetical protein